MARINKGDTVKHTRTIGGITSSVTGVVTDTDGHWLTYRTDDGSYLDAAVEAVSLVTIPTPVELEQANCKHQATKRFSVSLDIDKCMQCNAYLVWCSNRKHDKARHWHRVAHADDAAQMAKAMQ